MFARILVPLDGSTRAESALPVAGQLASAAGGGVYLLRAISAPLELGGMLEPSAMLLEAIEAKRQEALDYLSHVRAHSFASDQHVELRALEGPAARTILEEAADERVDLIVMCSHGRSGLTRWALGSVAQKVARRAPCPVLVTREGGPSLANMQRPLRALVALDGSPLAERAIRPAIETVTALSRPNRGVLRLLRITPEYPAPGAPLDPSSERTQTMIAEATLYLEQVAARVKAGDFGASEIDIETVVANDSDVAAAIVDSADMPDGAGAHDVDLVALSTHGWSGMRLWALGSVTERVLQATRLPSLVVRAWDADLAAGPDTERAMTEDWPGYE